MKTFVPGSSLAALLILASVHPAAGQSAPGWSRGQQTLAISADECLRRARAAIQSNGYRTDYNAGNFVVGIKDPHTAVVICSPGPAANVFVQIVVASNGPGGGVERQRLQAAMESSGTASTTSAKGGSTASNGVGAQWTTTAMGYTRDPQHHHPPEQVTFTCPPGGPAQANGVTGGPTYTDDSPVCQAAVHAGLITPARGGAVTFVTMAPGVNKYVGSTQNGYRSNSDDNGPNPTIGAFRFVNAPAYQPGTATRVIRPSADGTGSATPSRSAHGCNGFEGTWKGPYGLMTLRNGSGSYGGIALRGTRLAGTTLSGTYSSATAGTGTFTFTLAGNGDSLGSNFVSSAGVQGQYTVMQCAGP